MRSRDALRNTPEPLDSGDQSTDPLEQIRHWVRVVRRQWAWMLLTWLVVMAGATAVLASWPRQYKSAAKFLVRNARQELLVNPTDGAAPAFRDVVSEEAINSELELLRSRDILARVVRELRLNVPEHEGEDADLVLERAVRGLGQALEMGPIRKTNLIQVAYESTDPKQAAAVLRHLADAYLAMHLSVHSSPGTYEFFKQQVAASEAKWQAAQQELSALARSSNLMIPDEQRRAALSAANVLEAELAGLEAQISEQAARARSTEMQSGVVDARIVTQERKVPNQPSIERLHTLIVELKNKRTQLLTKFLPTDRLVVEYDEQIATTEAALKDASALKAMEEATDLNPTWQVLQTEKANAQLALAGLTTKAQRLQAHLAQYRARAVSLSEQAPRYEALSRAVAEARAEYELYAKRAEEARVADALDQRKISNVVLAEAPIASHIPSKPRVKLSLVVAAMMASLLAIGVGLGAEWRRARAPSRVIGGSYTSVTGRVGASEA
jgi:polysaccharide biosynthesis transport protein